MIYLLLLSLLGNLYLGIKYYNEKKEANRWFMKWSKPYLNSQLEQIEIFRRNNIVK